MKFIIDFIDTLGPIPKKSSDKLISLIQFKELKKGDSFAKIGEIPKHIYLLKKV